MPTSDAARAKQNEYSKARYYGLIAKGLCASCGKVPGYNGQILCKACAERRKANFIRNMENMTDEQRKAWKDKRREYHREYDKLSKRAVFRRAKNHN